MLMKRIDLDRERSEKKLTLKEFLASYNQDLPPGYPRASAAYLADFIGTHPELFKEKNVWSLDKHRKRVMDWLPGYVRSHS